MNDGKDNSPEHHTHMLMCRMVLNNVIVPPAPENPMNADVEKAVELDELKSAEIKFAQLAWRKALSEEDGYAGASKLMTECFRDGFYAGVRTYWDRVDALHTERVQANRALRDQEAEIAGLRADLGDADERAAMRNRERTEAVMRAEKAEALLRGACAFMQFADGHGPVSAQLMHRITAHLGGEHE